MDVAINRLFQSFQDEVNARQNEDMDEIHIQVRDSDYDPSNNRPMSFITSNVTRRLTDNMTPKPMSHNRRETEP